MRDILSPELESFIKSSRTHGSSHIFSLQGREQEERRAEKIHPSTAKAARILIHTTWTHSIRGSLTAWFPDRLTTQAGVSGVASSRAITASTPILLP